MKTPFKKTYKWGEYEVHARPLFIIIFLLTYTLALTLEDNIFVAFLYAMSMIFLGWSQSFGEIKLK